MAELRQFLKGETINITVTPEPNSGVVIDVSDAELYVYPDSLNLNDPSNGNKVLKFEGETEDESIIFQITPTYTGANIMPAGDYTVELKYGTDNDITIVKENHAFTLVESGSDIYIAPTT